MVRAKYNVSEPAGRRTRRRDRRADADRRRKQPARHRWRFRAKVYGIASIAVGQASRRISTPATRHDPRRPARRLAEQTNGTTPAGVDVAVSPRLTLIADVLGRTIRDQGRLREADTSLRFRAGGPGRHRRRRGGGGGGGGGVAGLALRPAGRSSTSTRREFRLEPGNLNLAVGNAGVRFNPLRKMLVSANLLFALTECGPARSRDARDQRRLLVLTASSV